MSEQELFEKWARPDSVQKHRNPETGEYTERGMSAAWSGWMASVKAHGVTGPEVWIVLDEDGIPTFCAGWPQACHEHINDAINEHDIEHAGKWQVVRAVVTPNAKTVGPDAALSRQVPHE